MGIAHLDLIPLHFWIFASLIAFAAGIVKGAVGFAMPMIVISGISSFYSPELALAALILPTLMSNLMQTLRGGMVSAAQKLWAQRVFVAAMVVVMAIAAQIPGRISESVFLLAVGIPVVLLSIVQILGWRPSIARARRIFVEVPVAIFAGFFGGMAGIWGPPTTMYLTAIGTPKKDQLQIQGAIYGVGSVVLLLAHLRSGILNQATLPVSAAMVVPAMLGMLVGFRLHDRMDQERFRRATLFVLVVAGLNLIRRGLGW